VKSGKWMRSQVSNVSEKKESMGVGTVEHVVAVAGTAE
jgi:hypothetical protein